MVIIFIPCQKYGSQPEAEYEYDCHVDPYDSNAYTTTENSDVDRQYNSSSSDNNDSNSQYNSSTQGSPSVVEADVAVKRNVSNNDMTIFTRPPSVQEMLSPSHHSNANNSINEMNNISQQKTSSSSTALLKGGVNDDTINHGLHSSSSRYSSSSFELQCKNHIHRRLWLIMLL